MTTAPTTTREGELLSGKYRLERLLGTGGMGEVYRAENVHIGRTVAIKILKPELASNNEVVTRFLREARAANIVRHPNVVDVLDIGQDDQGVPYIVQEFLQGTDLARHLEDLGGRVPAEAVLRMLLPVIEAIGVAHAKGVVHRDLKPENIFLHREGNTFVPKVLDFGISKINSASANEVRVTATGVAMGTPAYMSPEQVQGVRTVEPASDVWALGVILYEILAGDLPFQGETHGAIFLQICTAEPTRLQDVAQHVSDEMERIVMRCLSKKAAERYPTASELAKNLKAALESGAMKAPAVERKTLTHLASRTGPELPPLANLPPPPPPPPPPTASLPPKVSEGSNPHPAARPEVAGFVSTRESFMIDAGGGPDELDISPLTSAMESLPTLTEESTGRRLAGRITTGSSPDARLPPPSAPGAAALTAPVMRPRLIEPEPSSGSQSGGSGVHPSPRVPHASAPDINLAVQPSRRRPAPGEFVSHASSSNADGDRFVGMALGGFAAVLGIMVLSAFLGSRGWEFLAWTVRTFGRAGASTLGAAAILTGLGTLVAGGLAFGRPATAWGYALSAGGFLVLTYFFGTSAASGTWPVVAGPSSAQGAAGVLPYAAAVVPGGIGLQFVLDAVELMRDAGSRRNVGIALLALSLGGLYSALELARGSAIPVAALPAEEPQYQSGSGERDDGIFRRRGPLTGTNGTR